MKFNYLKAVWMLFFQPQVSKNETFLYLDADAEHEYQQGLYFEQLARNHLHLQLGPQDNHHLLQTKSIIFTPHFAYFNERNAVWCFLKSALRGHPAAEYKIGIAYLNGQLSLNRDYIKAEKWLKRAAKDGYPDADRYLDNAGSQLEFSS